MNIRGIHNNPYIDLTNHIDLESYDKLLPEIYRGFATARHLLIDGFQTIKTNSGRPGKFKALYQALEELKALPDNDIIKQGAQGLDYNQLTTYLKYALNGYDSYSKYILFEDCKHELVLKEAAHHFPNLMKWVENLKTSGVFSVIEGAGFFLLEGGGIPFEHCDPAEPGVDVTNDFNIPEFIHIKPDLDRPFYLFDPETDEKFYINSRVSWWNERDWHGGDPVLKPTFAFRIDGIFTDEFRSKVTGVVNA
jgi:hypothetical protein